MGFHRAVLILAHSRDYWTLVARWDDRTAQLITPLLRGRPLDRSPDHSGRVVSLVHMNISALQREYNESRPHRPLKDRTPAEFAKQAAENPLCALGITAGQPP